MNTGNVPFKQLSDEQKGWLLLQHHKGLTIQILGVVDNNKWVDTDPRWNPEHYYRVKPAPQEVSFVRTLRNKVLTICCTECPDTHELSDFKITSVTDA